MAKRKRTVTRRRRRIGAVSAAGLAPTLGGAALGVIAGRMVASKLLANMDSKISSAITAAAGIFLAMQKTPLVKGVGVGMFANGVITLGTSMNLISGVSGYGKSSYLEGYPENEMPVIAGGMNLNYLGNPQGSPEMNVISGIGNPQGDAEYPVIAGSELVC